MTQNGRGSKGALHYQPLSSSTESTSEDMTSNNLRIERNTNGNPAILYHQFTDLVDGDIVSSSTQYKVHQVGVLNDVAIVDTTGAGDAFIGGYLMACLFASPTVDNVRQHVRDDELVQFALEFASWVSARKLGGPGARSALPRGIDVDEMLGKDYTSVKRTLEESLSMFWQ